MPLYLVRIKNNRLWERDTYELPWLGESDVPADVLGDLRPKDGELSIWHIEDDKSNLDDVITAIAATRDHPDVFDYGLVPHPVLVESNLQPVETMSDTPVARANHWHRDLVELTVDRFALFVKTAFNRMETGRVLQNDIEQMLRDAVAASQLDLDAESLKKSMRRKIS